MTNKTKKISILTTALAGSLIATSIGAIALSACATSNNNTNNTTPEDPNSEFEGNAFSKTIDWNNKVEVDKLITDQGLVFSDESKIEVIAILPNSELTEITIPSSVRAITGYKDSTQYSSSNREGATTVNKGAFQGNTKITKVSFAGNTYNIGKQAFKDATALKTIVLPKTLNIIDNYAFEGCKSLESIDLSNVKIIGHSAFKDAFPTATVTRNGETVEQPTNTISFKKVVSIGNNAFENANIKEITFNENTQLRNIGVAAFKGATLGSILDLSSLTNLTEIENETFANTKGLTEIKLPENITSLGTSVFSGTSATTLDLSNIKATSIPSKAFLNASSLSSLKLPTTIASFGDNSFQGTTALQTLTLPTSLTTLGSNVFNAEYDQTNASTVTVKPAGVTSLDLSKTKVTTLPNNVFAGCNKLSSVNLNNETKIIPTNAFAGSGISSITLPENVTTIGDNAFSNITNLSSISFGTKAATNSTKLDFTNGTNVSSIGANAFSGVNNVTEADLSKATSLTTIPAGIFSGSSKLATVTLPESITTISAGAFSKNGALSKLGFKTAVVTAGKLDFTNGTNVSSIGENAFAETAFTDADLSKANVTTIPVGIFSGAKELSNVVLNENTTKISENAFSKNTKLSKLGFKTATATNGKLDFTNGTNVSSIGENAFDGTAFTDADLSAASALTTIGENAFSNNAKLETLKLPSTLTSNIVNIANNVKEGFKLTYPNGFTINGTTTTISFANNQLLTDVDLSTSSALTTIAKDTFSGSTKLSKVVLPAKAVKWELNDTNNGGNPFFNNADTLNIEFTVFKKQDNNAPNDFNDINSSNEIKTQIANIMNIFSRYVAVQNETITQYDNWTPKSSVNNFWINTDLTKDTVFKTWANGSTALPDLTDTNGATKTHNGVTWTYTKDTSGNITITSSEQTPINIYRAGTALDSSTNVISGGKQTYFSSPSQLIRSNEPNVKNKVKVTLRIKG